MRSPEASTVYLEHCLAAFMDALRGAQALSKASDAFELAEVLQHAGELLNIIADELNPHQAAAADVELELLRAMLRVPVIIPRGA